MFFGQVMSAGEESTLTGKAATRSSFRPQICGRGGVSHQGRREARASKQVQEAPASAQRVLVRVATPPYDCAQAHKDAVLDRMNAELAGARDRISALELENKELLQEKLDLHASVASFRALNEKLGADLAEFKAASHVGNQTVESLRVEIARLTAEQA